MSECFLCCLGTGRWVEMACLDIFDDEKTLSLWIEGGKGKSNDEEKLRA